MHPWPPLVHVRAIGAWPLRGRTGQPFRMLHPRIFSNGFMAQSRPLWQPQSDLDMLEELVGLKDDPKQKKAKKPAQGKQKKKQKASAAAAAPPSSPPSPKSSASMSSTFISHLQYLQKMTAQNKSAKSSPQNKSKPTTTQKPARPPQSPESHTPFRNDRDYLETLTGLPSYQDRTKKNTTPKPSKHPNTNASEVLDPRIRALDYIKDVTEDNPDPKLPPHRQNQPIPDQWGNEDIVIDYKARHRLWRKIDKNISSRAYDKSNLPLPPWMRDDAPITKRTRLFRAQVRMERQQEGEPIDSTAHFNERQLERAREETEQNYTQIGRKWGFALLSWEKAKAEAPFSTALASNPYAKALATPVRQDSFSHARVPISCLVDLHILDASDHGDNSKLALQPLSFAHELNSHNPQDSRDSNLQAWIEESQSYHPSNGSTSFVTQNEQLFDYTTANAPKKLSKIVLGPSAIEKLHQERIDKDSLGWRPDMTNFIRRALGRLVRRYLYPILLRKTDPDAPGPVCTPPGKNAKFYRIHEVDNVECVVWLKPQSMEAMDLWNEEQAPMDSAIAIDSNNLQHGDSDRSSSSLDSIISDQNSDEPANMAGNNNEAEEAQQTLNLEQNGHSMLNGVAEDDFAAQADDLEAAEQAFEDFLESTGEPSPELSDVTTSEAEETTTPQTSEPRERKRSVTARQHAYTGPWIEKTPFLKNAKPLRTTSQPSITYFPTVRYRDRRVPLYNLPELIGHQETTELLQNTVFQDCNFLAMTAHPVNTEAQYWLLRLAGFTASRKQDTVHIPVATATV